MFPMRLPLAFLLAVWTGLLASPKQAPFLASHIVWERNLDELTRVLLTAAVADKKGTLWIIADTLDSARLIRMDASGSLLDSRALPPTILPQAPSEVARYKEAITPLGIIALLVDYSHGGRDQYFDGAKLGFFNADGSLGPLKRVAEAGPWNNALVALSDEHFLVLGDQSPM